jgi:hypothetical protein
MLNLRADIPVKINRLNCLQNAHDELFESGARSGEGKAVIKKNQSA